MKAIPLAFHGVLFGLLSTSLSATDPILATPGTASWQNKDIGTGIRTEFTLTDDTVLNWERLNLKSGSEMDFNFVGGDSVLNVLTGGKTHFINGAVTSNGNVGFVSPNASLVVGGSITAKSVTLSTLDVDSSDFADGGSLTLQGGAERLRFLNVRGELSATKGNVLVAGTLINIDPEGVVSAKAGSVLYAAGETVDVKRAGNKRLSASGAGNISHSGFSRAGRMEVAARTITNAGRFGNGSGHIFISVGPNGKISNQGNGVINVAGLSADSGIITETGSVNGFENDGLGAVNRATNLSIPEIENMDGSRATGALSISSNAPTSASLDAQRVASVRSKARSTSNVNSSSGGAGMRGGSSARAVAKADSSKSILRRSSFFGMRGGSKVATR